MDIKNTLRFSSIVFSFYILISFYVFGAGTVNAMVAYRTWRWVGPTEFPKFHQVDADLIIPLFVVFFFFSFVPQVLLFWLRPAAIPKGMIWLALMLNSIILVSTITIQIPIQGQLNETFSLELINQLISTDMLYRRIPATLLAITNFIMLFKVIKHNEV